MFGKAPFLVPDNCAVDVANLAAARAWYKEKLGWNEVKSDRKDESGRLFADWSVSNGETFLTIVELAPRVVAEKRHVVF